MLWRLREISVVQCKKKPVVVFFENALDEGKTAD